MKTHVPALVRLASVLMPVPALAQDVIWSSHPGPSLGSNVIGATPLGDGRVLGVLQTSVAGSSSHEWFLLDPAGVAAAGGTLPSYSSYAAVPRVAPDGAGGALVAVTEAAGALGGPPLGGYDVVVLHFDATGQQQSVRRFGGSGNDLARAVLSDGAGGYFLSGETWSSDFGTPTGAQRDGFVAHVGATGALTFVERVGTSGLYARIDALAPDGQGGVLAGGTHEDWSWTPITYSGFVARFDPAGQRVFHHPQAANGLILSIARTDSGGYVEVSLGFSGGSACTIHSASGSVTGSVPLSPAASIPDIASVVRREDGTFLIGGTLPLPGQSTAHVRSFDGGGAVLWDRSYPGAQGERTAIVSLALDAHDTLLVCGSIQTMTPAGQAWRGRVERVAAAPLGAQECAGRPNSTGAAALTAAAGSDARGDDALTVFTGGLPANTTGYYLAGRAAGLVPGAGGSQGDLCLGGAIGRLNRPGETLSSGAARRFHLVLDLDDLPSPGGALSALAGETWRFQAWYRDANPAPTSNFSSTVAVTLR